MDVPRSKIFNDVYFSAEDGLAETHHVFLIGNNLPQAWEETQSFTIGETGFGTGLNFLAAWKLFDEYARAGQALHFISVEKYPITAVEIGNALSHWPQLQDYTGQLVNAYPDNPSGVFDHNFGKIRLTVFFDDVIAGLARIEPPVDCWFLDGFRPASNPDMWSDEVFAQMTRLSRAGTTFATFTSAGFVRRGLSAAGFDVRKVRGFGRKREMSVGTFR